MKRMLFLDSGAFSVWTQGASVKIEDYIQFCLDHPEFDYYVNLDVIAGEPGNPRSKTPESQELACLGGWNNYQRMIRQLPIEKVIPVFHKGENWSWLEKYLEFGSPYIGLGQIHFFGGTFSRVYASGDCDLHQRAWIQGVRDRLCGSDGRPRVKTHGFAVTAFRLMKAFPWHSVDSASWLRQASYGTVYIPRFKNGKYTYDEDPLLLNFSPKSPSVDDRGAHYFNLGPTAKASVDEYLKTIKAPLGSYHIEDVPAGTKRKDGMLWWDKAKTKMMVIDEEGVVTSHHFRIYANVRFMQRANVVLDLDHIYFAGSEGSLREAIELRLKRRLMSYHTICNQASARRLLKTYAQLRLEEIGA
jgi:hypothetical protein